MGDYNAYQNARKVFPVSVSSVEYEDNPNVVENFIFDATVSDVIEAYKNGNVVEISVLSYTDEDEHIESKWILDSVRQMTEAPIIMHFNGKHDFNVQISHNQIDSLLKIANSTLYGEETSSEPKLVEITLTPTDVDGTYTASKTGQELSNIIANGDVPYFKFTVANVFINGLTGAFIFPGMSEGIICVQMLSYVSAMGNAVQAQMFEIDTNSSSEPS